VLTFELLAALYFAAFGVIAAGADIPWRRRAVGMAVSLGASLSIVALAPRMTPEVRAWAPHLYLIGGYWVPGLLVPRLTAATRFERWLAASDRRVRPRLPAVPAPLSHVAELAYLLCYPLVPAAFVVVSTLGRDADVNRFWLAVLTAGYASYATLPWLLSRPPRLLGDTATPAAYFGTANAFVLGRVSHRLNTFPSGHVAVSCASAGAMWSVSPVAAVILGALAAAIAVGAAAGRYHYVVDVGLGIAVAIGAVALARMA
jgi:hypothetical protein